MAINVTQLNFFEDGTSYIEGKNALKFCIKKHDAKTAKLHYDIRLQFKNSVLISFAVKPGLSMDPEMFAEGVLVPDHFMNAFRREGTILIGKGEGAVLHFDEGLYSIPGVRNLKELIKALEIGLKRGSFIVIFDGYKMKGEFIFSLRTDAKGTKWTIRKTNDGYATNAEDIIQEGSILTNKKLDYYIELYKKQRSILAALNPTEYDKFIKDNIGDSFMYKNHKLSPRPNKIFPFD